LGDQAFELFSFLNPITHSINVESANQYAVEPYVVAADVYSAEPFIGRGGWTWYTGSSGWLYRLGLEAILGFKVRHDHIKMEPCIPAAWDGYQLTYNKDGCVYHIQVKNPNHVQTGVERVIFDGNELKDNLIRLSDDESAHFIEVIMG